MSYFVRIDRDTIESNPNYGVRNIVQVGPKEVLLSIYIDPEKVDMQNINQANFTFYGYEYNSIDMCCENGLIKISMNTPFVNDEQRNAFAELLLDLGSKGIIRQINSNYLVNCIDLTCCNVPKYFYEYEPLEVTCQYCGAKFDHSELRNYWDEAEVYVENECPYCGHSDCVEIVYERLSEDV